LVVHLQIMVLVVNMMNKTKLILLFMTLFLLGCGGSNENTVSDTVDEFEFPFDISTVEIKPNNWYIRIVAEDISLGLKSESAQLGALEESDAVTKHTLASYKSFDAYLDVLFVDPDGLKEGQYKTNYHTFKNDAEDTWMFTVMSRDTNATISLSWRGLYVLTPYIDANRKLYKEYRSTSNPFSKQMKLVDTVTNQEIPAIRDGEVQTYLFNMDGSTERTFKWIVLTEEVNIENAVSKSAAYKQLTKKIVPVKQKAFKEKRIESFDLNRPPMTEERR